MKKFRREYFEKEPLIIKVMSARALISVIFFSTFYLSTYLISASEWSRAKIVRV